MQVATRPLGGSKLLEIANEGLPLRRRATHAWSTIYAALTIAVDDRLKKLLKSTPFGTEGRSGGDTKANAVIKKTSYSATPAEKPSENQVRRLAPFWPPGF